MTEYEESVVDALREHRYLERKMIQSKIFKTKAGGRYARTVLLKMHQREMIGRFREKGSDEYIYHLGRKSQKWSHWLDLNRFHFSLIKELKQWQRIIYWDYEVRYLYGVADALYIVRLTLEEGGISDGKGKGVSFFLEMDDGQNKFDKISKYLAYQQSKTWVKEWWGQAFPLVVIVTPRVEEIKEIARRCKAEKFFRVLKKEKEYIGIIKQIKEG